MEQQRRAHLRILGAILCSAALIGGAYLLARSGAVPHIVEAATDTALLEQIANRDSTGDGLPDWQKALYGIPLTATTTDYFGLGMTDGEAVAKGLIVPVASGPTAVASSTPVLGGPSVDGIAPPAPGSLTALFATKFLALYAQAKATHADGSALSSSEINDISDQALAQISDASQIPDFKNGSDLTVSGSGNDAMIAFAAAAEASLARHRSQATMSDLDYLQAALDGDTSAPSHLADLSASYRDSAIGLSVLPVPTELASADLAIVNQLMRLSSIYDAFSRVNSDPLAAMLAIGQYRDTELATEQSFRVLAAVYSAHGVVLKNGTPGAGFVNLIANLAASQRAAQNP